MQNLQFTSLEENAGLMRNMMLRSLLPPSLREVDRVAGVWRLGEMSFEAKTKTPVSLKEMFERFRDDEVRSAFEMLKSRHKEFETALDVRRHRPIKVSCPPLLSQPMLTLLSPPCMYVSKF
jgi:hypothetical protein